MNNNANNHIEFTWHPFKNQKILYSYGFSCSLCSQGKNFMRPSPAKVGTEAPSFMERMQGDICWPIPSTCGPFRYFMV